MYIVSSKMQFLKLFIATTLFFHGSCQSSDQIVSGYNLSKPTKTIALRKGLKEISGLTYLNNYIYAIQDEKGNLYEIDIKKESSKKYDFAKDGDFESVEAVDNIIYAMTSKGACYHLEIIDDSVSTEKLDRFIKKNRNLEGMAYDPDEKKLLMASKGSLQDSTKEILIFDMETMKLEEEPFYTLDQENLRTMSGTISQYSFNPSAIAIHPRTKDLYILSHPNQQLLILNKEKEIKSLTPLNASLFKQPEGICFDKIGTLFISTEGRDGPGKLFIFKPIKG